MAKVADFSVGYTAEETRLIGIITRMRNENKELNGLLCKANDIAVAAKRGWEIHTLESMIKKLLKIIAKLPQADLNKQDELDIQKAQKSQETT